MEEKKYVRFCPKHGPHGDDQVCSKCGRETLLSDVTTTQLKEWGSSQDEQEKQFPYRFYEACKTDLDKIIKNLRSGKNGKVVDALKLLAWKPERDEYIEEVTKWQHGFRYAVKDCSFFLYRCTYEKVRPYLDFKYYDCDDKYSVELFMPLFLEHYKQQKPLPCEKCGRETNNLFFRITTTGDKGASVKKGSYIYTEIHYTGHAIPHAYCDECALKKAGKKKKLQGLSDAEKIKAWMNIDVTSNAGFLADLGLDTPGGYGYDYLTSPAAREDMTRLALETVGQQKAVLAAMIECALELKKTLGETP